MSNSKKTAVEACREVSKALRANLDSLKKTEDSFSPKAAALRVLPEVVNQIKAYEEQLVKMRQLESGDLEKKAPEYMSKGKIPGQDKPKPPPPKPAIEEGKGLASVDKWHANMFPEVQKALATMNKAVTPSHQAAVAQSGSATATAPVLPSPVPMKAGKAPRGGSMKAAAAGAGFSPLGAAAAPLPYKPTRAAGDPAFDNSYNVNFATPHGVYTTRGGFGASGPNSVGGIELHYKPNKGVIPGLPASSKKLGTFPNKEAAYAARDAHHDQKAAGIIKAEPEPGVSTTSPESNLEESHKFKLDKTSIMEAQKKQEKAKPNDKKLKDERGKKSILPGDAAPKEVSHDEAGDIVKGKKLSKAEAHEVLNKALPRIGGKDPASKMMTSHAMAVGSKAAAPAAPAPLPKAPSPKIHAERQATFSDFTPKGKFDKNELEKVASLFDKSKNDSSPAKVAKMPSAQLPKMPKLPKMPMMKGAGDTATNAMSGAASGGGSGEAPSPSIVTSGGVQGAANTATPKSVSVTPMAPTGITRKSEMTKGMEDMAKAFDKKGKYLTPDKLLPKPGMQQGRRIVGGPHPIFHRRVHLPGKK